MGKNCWENGIVAGFRHVGNCFVQERGDESGSGDIIVHGKVQEAVKVAPIAEESALGLFQQALRSHPDRVCVCSYENGAITRILSYAETWDRALNLGGYFMSQGLRLGDRVAFVGRPGIEYVVCSVACAALRLVIAPIDSMLPARIRHEQVKKSGAKLAVAVGGAMKPLSKKVAQLLRGVATVVVGGGKESLENFGGRPSDGSVIRFSDAWRKGAARREEVERLVLELGEAGAAEEAERGCVWIGWGTGEEGGTSGGGGEEGMATGGGGEEGMATGGGGEGGGGEGGGGEGGGGGGVVLTNRDEMEALERIWQSGLGAHELNTANTPPSIPRTSPTYRIISYLYLTNPGDRLQRLSSWLQAGSEVTLFNPLKVMETIRAMRVSVLMIVHVIARALRKEVKMQLRMKGGMVAGSLLDSDEKALEEIRQHRVLPTSTFSLTPLLWRGLRKVCGEEVQLVISGAPLSEIDRAFLSSIFHCPIIQGFGTTTTQIALSSSTAIPFPLAHCPPAPSISATLQPLPAHPHLSQILVKKRREVDGEEEEEVRKKELAGGGREWEKTGFLGSLMEDGSLHVEGRLDAVTEEGLNLFAIEQELADRLETACAVFVCTQRVSEEELAGSKVADEKLGVFSGTANWGRGKKMAAGGGGDEVVVDLHIVLLTSDGLSSKWATLHPRDGEKEWEKEERFEAMARFEIDNVQKTLRPFFHTTLPLHITVRLNSIKTVCPPPPWSLNNFIDHDGHYRRAKMASVLVGIGPPFPDEHKLELVEDDTEEADAGGGEETPSALPPPTPTTPMPPTPSAPDAAPEMTYDFDL